MSFSALCEPAELRLGDASLGERHRFAYGLLADQRLELLERHE